MADLQDSLVNDYQYQPRPEPDASRFVPGNNPQTFTPIQAQYTTKARNKPHPSMAQPVQRFQKRGK